jgi:predicted RNase H-like HicB family nuclease
MSHQPAGPVLSAPQFTAVVKQDGPWWIGWIEEMPGVNAQERSREDLLVCLYEALSEAMAMTYESGQPT